LKEGAVEAAIERRNDAVVEWARSASTIYANGRGKMAAFGPVATDGAVRLTREGDALMVTPLPKSPRFTVRLTAASLPFGMKEPRGGEALDENGAALGKVALTREGSELVLACEPGVFAYRLR
jgi:hypothetical protein